MIVKNEAHHLPDLFKSIKGCFDEVHITDTGSTDNTIEIATNLGAKVHHFDWISDFSEARNYSFSHTTTDYIAWIDGDDWLTNKEAFIKWRDHAMAFGDIWLANYHYASDEDGTPRVTFTRERVVKRDLFKWRYFLHEGLTPKDPHKPMRMQGISTWSVTHQRTLADIHTDRARNLKIFENHKGSMDARMIFYWGKELFENQKPMEAYAKLKQSIDDPNLEIHDRILGMQYACYSAMACNELETAIKLAHLGLQLDPNRAEFNIILGDSYVKAGKPLESIPFYGAAKHSIYKQDHSSFSPIYSLKDQYDYYPRLQLSKVNAHIGRLDEALKDAEENYKEYPREECKAVLDEIKKIMSIAVVNVQAEPCQDIVISCRPPGVYEWDEEVYKQKAMGGSETAAIEMAKWLRKLTGLPVKIFNDRQSDKTCESGVEYIQANKANDYFQRHKPRLHIAWRHNIKMTDAPTYLWCHDLMTQTVEKFQNFDKIMCLTPFHSNYVQAMQGVSKDKIWVTRNGINPERFLGPMPTKNPNKIVFPSSPDRGLERAIKVMDKAREEFPDLELHVFYGIEHLDKYGLKDLRIKLDKMMKERSWVKYHGATQQDELTKHLKEAVVWLHPCDFIETSAITAIEMICAGVYPVTRRLGGLQDTLRDAEEKGMAQMLDHDCITEDEFKAYTDSLKQVLKQRLWEKIQVDPNKLSWESVAREWIDYLDLPLLDKSVRPPHLMDSNMDVAAKMRGVRTPLTEFKQPVREIS